MKPPRIIIHPPTIIFAVLLILLDHSTLALMPFLAAVCHEAGHLAVMLFCGVQVREIEITLFGAEIRSLPYDSRFWRTVAIYFAGAGTNLLSAAIVFLLPAVTPELLFFAVSSLTLAILNLFPIGTLDGGRILAALIDGIAPAYAPMILSVIQSAALFILWLAATYVLLLCGGNVSLYFFCLYLFWELYLRKQTAV